LAITFSKEEKLEKAEYEERKKKAEGKLMNSKLSP
jgi:hypothetical protein